MICLNGQSLCLSFMQSFILFVKFTKTGTTSTTFGLATKRASLKSLMLKCPNHELPKEIILTNFYARLSRQDKEMLDASSSGVFQTRSIEEKWDLIERIQKNTEDWEIYKGIEPTINQEHDYIESYVKTNYINTFCFKIGLD